MSDIVNVKDMYKSFFGAVALDGMNFSIGEGEVHSLIGENGCGKSTMIKVISGFHTFDKGHLYINGKEYEKITPIESMGEGIQVIYQDFSLFPKMTIAENITMYDAVKKNNKFVNWNKMRADAKKALDRIKFDIDIDKYVYELNVAQKQMVAICRAIAQDAKLIIMDEPTTALTSMEIENLFKMVGRLKSSGVSVLFVSHKLDEVLKISDNITVMRNGKNVYESNGESLSKEELIYHMTGKKISEERFNFSISSSIIIFRPESEGIFIILSSTEGTSTVAKVFSSFSSIIKPIFKLLFKINGNEVLLSINIGVITGKIFL